MVLKVALEVVVVVTKQAQFLFTLCLFLLSTVCNAAVLPADRSDALFHSYSGGGIDISGPAILVRKSIGDSVSLSAKHYVDTISSASIDVEVILLGASRYEEERVEQTFAIDYLNDKTLMSLGYTNSEENDFIANTISFGMSQDFFGDLTTLSMGYSHGDNTIGKTNFPSFAETSQSDNFNVSLAQVITKNFIMSGAFDVTTDAGFLNNPYRKVRYKDSLTTFDLEDEVYPKTRTSNAIAIRGRYFLPYRAALHAEVRTFTDSWGIRGNNFEIGYTHPFANNWIIEGHFRSYAQTKASFYSDLFPFSKAQNFLARDKELSTFNNNTIGFGISYEFLNNSESEDAFFDKASVNFKFDHIRFNYLDFRDARQTSFNAGEEPLYKLNANVIQLFVSAWF